MFRIREHCFATCLRVTLNQSITGPFLSYCLVSISILPRLLVLATLLGGCTNPTTSTSPDAVGYVLSPGRATVRQLPYSVEAEPAIFETSFFPGTQINQDSQQLKLQSRFLGNLPVSSGQIVAADPVSLHSETQPFMTRFPRGRFPVELALARFNGDERVAFARILFSDAPVVSWEPALLPGQKPLPLRSKEYYGYPVDAGMAFFMDAASIEPLNRYLAGKSASENLMVTSFRLDTSSPSPGFLYGIPPDTVAAFSTGFGDGSYASYVGLDAKHQPCRLLTDFQVISW
ncbi:DUF4241 domain-containing protein [Hymenobacter sediminis]|uniref:DUF4241 domain-containing protein n=1 Tax=Hymenobacter sediminis TaxID=2218621 RepID=UPI000DA6B26A|nr:DUF4241 domain-containing protein [Hymenobacter sediminis]RPD49503.1 DUF4241 domain-containing protein [Hymenobacter sediminis]